MGTMRTSLELGRAIRGPIKREIMQAAHVRGLQCRVQEEKGFWDSLYLFTFDGPDAVVLEFSHALERYLQKLEEPVRT